MDGVEFAGDGIVVSRTIQMVTKTLNHCLEQYMIYCLHQISSIVVGYGKIYFRICCQEKGRTMGKDHSLCHF